MGIAFQITGRAESAAAHPDDRRLNEEWIDFEGEPNEQWKAPTSLNVAIRDLVVSRGYK